MKKVFNHFVHALIRTPFSVAKRKLLDKRDHPGTDIAINTHIFSCGAVNERSSSRSSSASTADNGDDKSESNTFSDCRSDTTKYSLKSPTSVSSKRLTGSKSPRYINKSGSNRFTFESTDRSGGISPAAASKKKRRRPKFRFRHFCRRKTTTTSVASSAGRRGGSREGKSGKCIDTNIPFTPSFSSLACYNQCFPSTFIFDTESMAAESGKYRILIAVAIATTTARKKHILSTSCSYKENLTSKFTSNTTIPPSE